MEDNLLMTSVHLRCLSEITGKRIAREMQLLFEILDRAEYCLDLWRAINTIVHHKRIDAQLRKAPIAPNSKFGVGVFDFEVESSERKILVNARGFAVSAFNAFADQIGAPEVTTH